MFYIMRAVHLAPTPRKISLAKIMAEEPNCTVLVVDRETGWRKTSRTFVIGSAGDYGIKVESRANYTIDTGNGHRAGGHMIVRDILTVKDGAVVAGNADHPSAHAWVIK